MSRSTLWITGMIVIVGGFATLPAAAQEPRLDPEQPAALTHAGLLAEDVALIEAPPVDVAAARAEDEQREAQGLPPRYAIPNPVRITSETAGTWEELDEEMLLWRLRIASPGALSLNLGFTRYFMPPGGRLFIYSADLEQVIRPFTHRDNEEHGQLWTPVVLADEIVVEVTIPESVVERLDLELGSINVGYRGFGETTGSRSGACNVDVICSEGDGWRNEIKTVGVISTGGSTNCTGFMVNNTSEDLTPFFMTAQHCGVSSSTAASLVVYWNYENSWCRPPDSPESGQPGDGSLSQFQTGSVWRSSYGSSDFTLVEMDDDPDPVWDVGYAGWDRSSNDSTSAVAVHHPNCDEKRISFEDAPTATSSYLGTTSPGDGTHVWVDDWDLGTTEPGSSGSPLFDQNHRAVGQLHGGYAACGNDLSDWYGRFSVSWTGGGTSSSRLSDWLDPGGTGAMTTDFISLATQCSDAGEVEFLSPKYGCESVVTIRVVDCGPNVDPQVLDTVTVLIQSNSEVAGESVLLTETSVDVGKFEGTIQISTTDAPGVLLVADGDKLTVTYIDEDDGQGGTNVEVDTTADVDCTPPIISNVQTVNIEPRSATVTFDADEPALGTVWYGLSCGTWVDSATGTDYSTSGVVDLTDLQDDTTYFYALDAEDEAGNATTDDNGGNCYAFTTPQVPDFYTEEFGSDNDLDNISLFFTPNASVDFYGGCAEAITELPTDPAGGTAISLTDDSYGTVTLTGGASVSLYGTSYTTIYPGSNGYITFTGGDSDYSESLADHFDTPRVSGLFDDLDPAQSGTVSWKQLADRVAVTWEGVTEHNSGNSNTFQIELYFDGRITISYLLVVAADGVAGLSEGQGIDPDFLETDLTNMGACGPQPPVADSVSVNTAVSTPVTITLPSSDDGLPDPPATVTTIVTSLPAHGDLTDPGAGAITGVPYTLVGNGNQVEYQPDIDYDDTDSFGFKANDGGVPPEGGDSNTAVVTATMGGPGWDPTADDMEWSTGISVPADIVLSASDPNGDPLTYFIESLPAAGSLSDPGAGDITAAPYELVGGGKVVRYTPPPGQALDDTFDFSVRDATAGSNVATVTVTVGAPQVAHSFPLDTDPGWSIEGEWAFGQPTGGGSGNGDPTSGHTGPNVYGYDLNGDYGNDMSVEYLTTTAIDCTGMTEVELRFWRWLGVESSWFDHANVQVSNDGSNWTTLWENGTSTIDDSSWSQEVFDISAVADEESTVYVRWAMGPTDGSSTYGGWNIDDIEIWAIVWGTVPGDCTGDSLVTLDDLPAFETCMLGPEAGLDPGCDCADMDGDDDVDVKDFAEFQAACNAQ